jgi:hypothetical protein
MAIWSRCPTLQEMIVWFEACLYQLSFSHCILNAFCCIFELRVLRIRDFYPQILIFIHPGSRISDPRSNNSAKRGGGKI